MRVARSTMLLLGFQSLVIVTSSPIVADDKNVEVTTCPEVVKSHYVERWFPPYGPIGCRYRMESRDCLDIGLKAVSARTVAGYHPLFSRTAGASIDSSNPKCASVEYYVGVDHEGPEGRRCLQPRGYISYEVTLVPDCTP